MTSRGFKINKPGIARMAREIQREFDKNPITVPIHGDTSSNDPQPETTVYNGPVINVHGDRTQIAWNNTNASLRQASEEVAPGFEGLAEILVSVLRDLPEIPLENADRETAEVAARDVLREITKEHPDGGLVRRGVAALKGVVAPVALGTQAGISDEARKFARALVEQLGSVVS